MLVCIALLKQREKIFVQEITSMLNLTKVMIYLLTSCNAEVRIAQNIYIHKSNRNYKKLTTTTILIKKRIGIGYKNYKKQCPGLQFYPLTMIALLTSMLFIFCRRYLQ